MKVSTLFLGLIFLMLYGYYIDVMLSEVTRIEGVFLILNRGLVALLSICILFVRSTLKDLFKFMPFLIFYFFYMTKLFYEIFYLNIQTSIPANTYLVNSILISLLPILAISRFSIERLNFNILFKLSSKYFPFIFLIILIFSLPSLFSNLFGRLQLQRLNPISYGAFASICFYISLFNFVKSRKKIYLILSLLAVLVVIMTQSRSSYLGIFIFSLVILYSRFNIQKFLLFILFISIVISLALNLINFDILSLIFNIGSEKDLSSTYRLNTWSSIVDLSFEEILIGKSLFTSTGGYFHNILLESFFGLGFLVSMPIFYLYVKYFFNLMKFNSVPLEFQFFFVVTGHLSLVALFSGSLVESGPLICFLFIANHYFQTSSNKNNFFREKF